MKNNIPVLLQYILVSIGLILSSFFSFAQPTTLVKGDISIIAFSTDGLSGKRQVAFVPWVTLNSGTVIKFSDNGFLSTASATTANNYRALEQTVTWTANTTVSPGTVVTMVEQGNGITSNAGTVGMVNTGTAPQILFWSLAQAGDEIFIYQGADPTSASNPGNFLGTILFGLGYQGTSATFTNWLTTGSVNTNSSYLPGDLSGTNQIFLGANRTGGQYTAARAGLADIPAYKASVANAANWSVVTGGGTSITLDITNFNLNASLPLTLLSFDGKPSSNGIVLRWTTANEINTAGFDIERSANGSDFAAISSVPSTTTGIYTFTDRSASTNAFYLYRLKMRDRDGKYTYSAAINITGETKASVQYTVYPTPVTGSFLYIKPATGAPANIGIEIADLTGREWHTSKRTVSGITNGRFEIPVQQVPAGAYVLRIMNDNGKLLQTTKFIVTR